MPGEISKGDERRDLVIIGLNMRSNRAGLDRVSMEDLLSREGSSVVAGFQEAYLPERRAIGRVIEGLGYQAIFPKKSKMDLAFAVSPNLRIVGTDELPFPSEVRRSIHTKGPWARELGLFSIQVIDEAAGTALERPDRITTAHDPIYLMGRARKALGAWRSLWMPHLTATAGLHVFVADHNGAGSWQERHYDREQRLWNGKRLLPPNQVTYLLNPSKQDRSYGQKPETKGWGLDGAHASIPDGYKLIRLSEEENSNLEAKQVGFRTKVVDAKRSDHGAIVSNFSLPKVWEDEAENQTVGSISGNRALIVPDLEVDSVLDVSIEDINRLGIAHLLVDHDQTLMAPGESGIRPEIAEHLAYLKHNSPIKSINLATETARNIHRIAKPLSPGVIFRPYISRGRLILKSNPEFYARILDDLDIDPSTALMIGDQYLRDVKGAAWVGMKTAKVKPLGPDYWMDRCRRRRDDQALDMVKTVADEISHRVRR